MSTILNKHRDFYALVIVAFFCGILVYGHEVFNFTLSIDEEKQHLDLISLGLGRWGYSILKWFIFPSPYVPYGTAVIAIFFLALAAAMTAKLFKLTFIAGVAFVTLYVSFPHFAYTLQFIFQADLIAFGFFLGTSVVWFLIKLTDIDSSKRTVFFLAIINVMFMTLAISIYQALVIVPFIVLIGLDFKAALNSMFSYRVFIKKIFILSLLCIAAIALYFLISNLLINYIGVNRSEYLLQSIGWGKIPLWLSLWSISEEVFLVFMGQSFYGNQIFTTVLIPSFILIVFTIYSKHSQRYICLLLLVLLLVIPFSLSILLGKAQPPRLLLTLGICFSIIWIILVDYLSSQKYKNTSFILISLISIFYGTSMSSRLSYADKIARDIDASIVNRMLTYIYLKYPKIDFEKTPVYFHGGFVPQNNQLKIDTFGASFFEWDGGNNARIVSYINISGAASMHAIPANEVMIKVINNPKLHKLDIWPNPNSIELIDNVLVVKLNKNISDYYKEGFLHDIKPQFVNVTNKPSLNKKTLFHLDSCNKKPDRYIIGGWIVDLLKEKNLSVLIKKENHFYEIETRPEQRKDVTQYLNSSLKNDLNYDNVGFKSVLSTSQIADEPIDIYLNMISGDQNILIPTDCKFNQVEMKQIQIDETISDVQNLEYNLDNCKIENDQYVFNGWLANKKKENDSDEITTKILIKKEDKFYELNTKQETRKDVTQHLNNSLKNHLTYDDSGFRAVLSKSENIKNTSVYLLVQDAKGMQSVIRTDCKL